MERKFLWLVGAAMALYLLLPQRPVAVIVGQALAVVTAAAYWYGYFRHRPDGRWVWWALGGGLTSLCLGSFFRLGADDHTVVSLVFSLTGYGLGVVGALLLQRARGAREDRDSLLDAAILTTAAGVLLWQVAVIPALLRAATPAARVAAVTHPILTVLLFGLIVRLAIGPGTQVRSLHYIVSALLIALIGDLPILPFAEQHPVSRLSGMVARALVAAALLHPSVRELTRLDAVERTLRPRRLLLLLEGSLLLAGGLNAVELFRRGLEDAGRTVGPLILAALITVRLGHVLAAHEEARQQLAVLAERDPLTGIVNRRVLLERLAGALARAPRAGTVGVLFCDLNGFKQVNDRLGHGVGDVLLRAVAARLSNGLRPSDTLARLGGDEFVILSEDLDDAAGIEVIGDRIAAALREPFHFDGHRVLVSASTGVAVAADGDSAELLLSKADAAMYRRKQCYRLAAARSQLR